MKATNYNKAKLKKDSEVFYKDHHGNPQRSYISQVYNDRSYTVYSIFGVARPHLESEVFASRDEMIADFIDKTAKL